MVKNNDVFIEKLIIRSSISLENIDRYCRCIAATMLSLIDVKSVINSSHASVSLSEIKNAVNWNDICLRASENRMFWI